MSGVLAQDSSKASEILQLLRPPGRPIRDCLAVAGDVASQGQLFLRSARLGRSLPKSAPEMT